jgi:hypothetical protein
MKKQYGSGIMIEDGEQQDLLEIMSVTIVKTDSDDEEWFHNELKNPDQMNFSNFLKNYLKYRKDKMEKLISDGQQKELDKYQEKTFDLKKKIDDYLKRRKLIDVDIANMHAPTSVPKGGKRHKTKKRRKTIKKGGKKKRRKLSRKKTKKRRSSKR